MTSTNELITLINNFSLTDRLLIVEEILRGIREDEAAPLKGKKEGSASEKPKILEMIGVIDHEEAELMKAAVKEARKIDANEW